MNYYYNLPVITFNYHHFMTERGKLERVSNKTQDWVNERGKINQHRRYLWCKKTWCSENSEIKIGTILVGLVFHSRFAYLIQSINNHIVRWQKTKKTRFWKGSIRIPARYTKWLPFISTLNKQDSCLPTVAMPGLRHNWWGQIRFIHSRSEPTELNAFRPSVGIQCSS